MKDSIIQAVDKRYTGLSESNCCLSCGGAANRSNPKKGETFLDIGSGRGADAVKLAQEIGPDGMVYGLDISEGMIKKARRTAEKLDITNVQFLHAKFDNIPLKEHSINCVISNCTINHALNKQGVWNEIYRVLKKDGRFVVSDIYSTEIVPETFSSDPKAVAECWAGAVTKEKYLHTVSEAGFQEVEIIEESTPYEKGEINVISFTLSGKRKGSCCGGEC